MPLALNARFGRYEVLSRLGGGGMGEVYLAQDTKLGRRVAIKILASEVTSDQKRMRRFMQEAQAASALNHPNIITIYEIEETDSTPFIAAEFIDGETLHQYTRHTRLTISQSLDIAIQVASALSAAHTEGIIHRDIKPENIMLRRDGLVKLLDFGLAKLTQRQTHFLDAETTTGTSPKTVPGTVVGTLPYMSPEQARGLAVDARTDIWSLGCVLYEILTGQPPFRGDTATDVLAAILTANPAPLASHRTNAPAKLDQIVAKALEKDRGGRYQRITELLRDLQQLRDFETGARATQTRTPSGAERNAVDFPPNNLPVQRTSIVGRDREIEEIGCELRRESVRLVTLTGVGGTGKTTLALAAAWQLFRDFPDGIFFVDLAAVRQPELVAPVIAQQLGIKEADGRPIVEALRDHLRGKTELLVVDNFEQVLAAGSVLADLLAAAPGLKILVTSRARLHISIEHEYMVPPLAVPQMPAESSPDDLMRYGAVRLFGERARGVKANFVLTHDNALSVAGICARLDGLPFGIELAAARIKLLSPQAILGRLDHRLQLLTGGPRDLPARQQTMSATIEWSYELLTDEEAHLFRRLAVFVAGFTLESAERVVGDQQEASAMADVLDGITSLVDKSLLVATDEAGVDVRFRMLEVVREYAAERLDASGEAGAIQQKHAAYFLSLAEEAEKHLQGEGPAAWLNRLEEEYGNIRAALRWSITNQPETAARMAAAIRYFWDFEGYLTEGLAILKETLSIGKGVPTNVRCKLLSMAGNIARFQGDYETARKMHETGLTESRAVGDLPQVSLMCRGLGGLALVQGDHSTAHRFVEEALAAARKSNDRFGIARSLNMLGDLARCEGDNRRARPLLKEALEICSQLGHRYSTANILNNLAAAEYGEGDYTAAHSHFTEGLTMAQELGDKITGDKIAISYSLDGFAALAVYRGEAELGATLAGAAEQLRESMNFNNEPAERRFRDHYLARIRAVLSKEAFSAGYEHGRKSKLDESVSLALGKTA